MVLKLIGVNPFAPFALILNNMPVKKVTDILWCKKLLPIFQSPILSLFTFKKLKTLSFCHFFVITNRIIATCLPYAHPSRYFPKFSILSQPSLALALRQHCEAATFIPPSYGNKVLLCIIFDAFTKLTLI